ncbi:Nck-associated protein [Acrasis kona]|uniref:Nck-associated protein n=1 Tax=Acrasis kona TaxID=1008807 RepID=A0AAW2ZCF1_9EUKA
MFVDFEKPYVKLQEAFFSIQNHVGRALQNMLPVFDKGSLQYLNQKRPLEMLGEPDRIPYPAIDDTYIHIILHEEITEFVGFSYFCCPEALGLRAGKDSPSLKANKNAPDDRMWTLLLGKVLQNNFLLPLYGDEMINIHEPYQQLVKNYKTPSLNLKKDKSSLKAFEDHAAQYSAQSHRDKRNYLRMQLKTISRMMMDSQGLLGPKFQLVLALLALSRHELLWYFRHLEWNSKKYREVQDQDIAELVHLVEDMSQTCLKHREVIRTYHRKLLQGLYGPRTSNILESCRARFEGGQVLNVMQSIVDHINQSDSDLKALRLNWRRAEAYMSGYQFKASMLDQNCRLMFQTMLKVYELSRNIDEIEMQLVEKGSLKELYFYNKQVDQVFKDTLSGNQSQPLYVMSFVRILNSFPDNISKNLNQEMRKMIGRKSVSQGEGYLQSIVSHVRTMLDQLRGSPNGFLNLANQIGGDKVADRLKQRMLSRSSNSVGSSPNNPSSPNGPNSQSTSQRPGFESYYSSKNLIEHMTSIERNLTYCLFSLARSHEIAVYDTLFSPSEYLRDNLQQYVNQHLSLILMAKPSITKEGRNDQKTQDFRPPSQIMYELETFCMSLKIIEQCINVDVQELLTSALFDHMVNQQPINNPHNEADTIEPASMVYARWYVDMIYNSNNKYKLQFVPHKKSMVSTKDTPINGYRAEEYLDVNEMRVLARLMGPFGFKLMDDMLLDLIYQQVERLRDVISSLARVLREQEQLLYTEQALDKDMNKKFGGLENMLPIAITIGSLMEFRKCIKRSLRESASDYVPVIYKVLQSVSAQCENQSALVQKLIWDCGLEDEKNVGKDAVLNQKLESLVQASSVWDVLPVAFAVMLTLNKVWKDVDYNVQLEGWNNNAHLSITCFNELALALSACNNQDSQFSIDNTYTKFAEVSSMLLLNMRLAKNYEKQVNSCHIFADRLIKSCPSACTVSVQEEFSPYAMTRSIYVQTYEPLQRLNSVTAEGTNSSEAQE